MLDGATVDRNHPLRELFKEAINFGLRHNPLEKMEVVNYIEEQILCEFIHTDKLFKIRDNAGRILEDIADILAEGNVLLNAQSFEREFRVHKHIGDYTLFMLGMFSDALSIRRGKEFTLGQIVVPEGNLFDHYVLQGRRSYGIAAEFTDGDIFSELSVNFTYYQKILELIRIYLDANGNKKWLKARSIIGGTD
jgi:hypothetical protein